MRNVKENSGSRVPALFGITLPNIPALFQKNLGNKEASVEQPSPLPSGQKRSDNVPLHRTAFKTNPLVDHQFDRTISSGANILGGGATNVEEGFPHGPREISLSRHTRTADDDEIEENLVLSRETRAVEEMGVHFGYQVLSQQDLAFKLQNPEDEEKSGVMVFQVYILLIQTNY